MFVYTKCLQHERGKTQQICRKYVQHSKTERFEATLLLASYHLMALLLGENGKVLEGDKGFLAESERVGEKQYGVSFR